MNQTEVLGVMKNAVIELICREDPKADVAAWQARLEKSLTLEAPLSELGWDSLRMTWLLVRLEERLSVDTSTLHLYDLFTVGDLVDQLIARAPAP